VNRRPPDVRLAVVLASAWAFSTVAVLGYGWQVRDRLPDRVVRPWGFGEPSVAIPPDRLLLVTVGLATLSTALLGGVAVAGRQALLVRRTLAGAAAGVPAGLAVLIADGLRLHLDAAEATDVASGGAGPAVAALVMLVTAANAAASARPDPAGPPAERAPPPTAPRPDATDTGDALTTWRGGNRIVPVGLRWLVAGLLLGLSALAAALTWWLVPLAVVPPLTLLATARFDVAVDERGLTVTILGGRRMLHVPLAEVAGADVDRVDDPMREFGGWGLRVDAAGRTGVVTRPGPALRVTRSDGREVLITVDGAWDAAATLNLLADRRARGHQPPEDADGSMP
jgi:hypothetical protein